MKGCRRRFLFGRKSIRTTTTDLETGEKSYTFNHGEFKIGGRVFCKSVFFCPECSQKINKTRGKK